MAIDVSRERTPLRAALSAAVLLLLAGRAILGLLTWEPGWTTLTWDDYGRMALALQWADRPYLGAGDLVWLPLHSWLVGGLVRLTGGLFSESPLALAAMVNSLAVFGAAGLVGRAAWHLFRSEAGALAAFATMLFSPWGYYISLSAHNEGLYYLGIAAAVWGLAAHLTTGRSAPLFGGAGGVAATALLRYEGWWLALAWLGVLAAVHAKGWRSGARRAAVVAAALLPFGSPLLWLLVNLSAAGDPLAFARRSAVSFQGGFGGGVAIDPFLRVVFNPLTTFQAAPLLLPLLVLGALLSWRSHRQVRPVVGLVAIPFLLLYGTSLVLPTFGDLAHRYLFGFVVGLMPMVGAAPGLLARLQPVGLRRLAAGVLVALAVGVTAVRLADRPTEWRHGPDLLELTEALGEATAGKERLGVVIGPGMEQFWLPLALQNGTRVEVASADVEGLDDPALLPPGAGLWVERLGDRTFELPPAEAVIGRFHLYGPAATRLPLDPHCCPPGWVLRDEHGRTLVVPPGPYLALEFAADDPLPGDTASLLTELPRDGREPVRGSVELRWLYGHGVYQGRIILQVLLDEEVLFETDIGAPTRWVRVPFLVSPGSGPATLEVRLYAGEWVDSGWAWGRASTVLVRSVELGR